MRRAVLAALVVLGALIPYMALASFLFQHGFDVALLLRQVFATQGSTFFALDVLLSGVALLAVVAFDWRSVRMPWLVVVATVAIGPSCGLPLWLLSRTRGS